VVVFPLYLDALGAGDAAMRGRYLSYFLVPFALLQFFTGRMSERTGPFPPLIVGSLFYGVLLSTVGYAGLFALKPIMLLLGSLAAVMFPPAILLTARLSDSRSRGSAMGGFNQAGSIGFAVGPLLGAWAYTSGGFGVAFLICGLLEVGLAMVAAALYLRWKRIEAGEGADG
jgi:MFS family permease